MDVEPTLAQQFEHMGVSAGTHPTSDTAVRVDSQRGFQERVEFIGPGADRMFACLHLPLQPAVGAVLICSPILADFSANYSREVLAARTLAARGLAVQRFHYRGSGNSDGDPARMTFESLREDALLAADRVRGAARSDRLALLGTRWGGLVAASVAPAFPDAPLALWEPTVEPGRFFHDALRARMMGDVKQRREAPAAQQLLSELETPGGIDILGYPIYGALHESSQARSLVGELGDDPRPLQLVQFGRSDQLRGEYQQLVATLGKRGFRPAVVMTDTVESWWFHSERILPMGDSVEHTADWLEDELTPKALP